MSVRRTRGAPRRARLEWGFPLDPLDGAALSLSNAGRRKLPCPRPVAPHGPPPDSKMARGMGELTEGGMYKTLFCGPIDGSLSNRPVWVQAQGVWRHPMAQGSAQCPQCSGLFDSYWPLL